MMKNYYIILGIEPEATPRQIKAAYRRRAKSLHPDHYGKDSQPFLDLQEAYDVLIDPRQRAAYDNQVKSSRRRIRPRPTSAEPVVSSTVRPEPLIPTDRPTRPMYDGRRPFDGPSRRYSVEDLLEQILFILDW